VSRAPLFAGFCVAAFVGACASARTHDLPPPGPPPVAALLDAAAPSASPVVDAPVAGVATSASAAPTASSAPAAPEVADPTDTGSTASAADLMAMDPGIPRVGPRAAVFLVNVDAVRATPFSAALAMLVAAKPGWSNVLAAPRVDWVLISGPSINRSDRDVAIVRCAARDDAIDAWIDTMATPTATGPMSIAGAPGVRAVSVNIEGAARVAMRVEPHVVAFVPPDVVFEAARALSVVPFPARVSSREAVRFVQKDPRAAFSDSTYDGVTELRMWLEPTPAGEAAGFMEEEAATPALARKAADALRAWVQTNNKDTTMIETHGLLDHVTVTTQGRVSKARLHASRDQIRTILALIGKDLGVGPLPLP